MTARFFFVIAYLFSSVVNALEYRIEVEKPSLFNVEEAIANTIKGAAEKLTGIPEAQMISRASDLFSLSEALVNSYGYDGDTFIVDIDVDGLKARLVTAGIELWETERPELLIWATEERGLERLMIGQESNLIIDRLLAASQRFGVPMQRPLMDLEDTLALSPAEIWGEFAGAVTNASARYGIPHILVIGDRPERQSLKYWLFESNGEYRTGEIFGADSDARAYALIEVVMQYARSVSETMEPIQVASIEERDSLTSFRPGDEIVAGQWTVRVEYTDVIRLMDLIDHLETSDGVAIEATEIRATDASIVLNTQLSLGATDDVVSAFKSIQFISPLVYSLK
ncbi:MAG: DUF2066 domain-containing protein [Gammaproteobacteria bacterium]|jgi:hypothetical protein